MDLWSWSGPHCSVLLGLRLQISHLCSICIAEQETEWAAEGEIKSEIKAITQQVMKTSASHNLNRNSAVEAVNQLCALITISKTLISLAEVSLPALSLQLLTALRSLGAGGVIHTGIKLQNIMLVNHRNQPLRVKLIGFGLATTGAGITCGAIIHIQVWMCAASMHLYLFNNVMFDTPTCRLPDVILGIPSQRQ